MKYVLITGAAGLIGIGLDHPGLHFEIVYGVSGNTRTWWDNAGAERLGYRPSVRLVRETDAALP